MTQIVVSMVVIVLVAGVVTAYVAFPHRGEEMPGVPWLGRLMRRGAQSLPTVDPEPGDILSDGEVAEEPSPIATHPAEPGEPGLGPVQGERGGSHRA